MLGLMKQVTVKGMSHITGGGISENLPRILPANVHASIDSSSWQQGPVFDWLQSTGNIEADEMRRTFNCGVGMIVVVAADELETALGALAAMGENAWHIGDVRSDTAPVEFL